MRNWPSSIRRTARFGPNLLRPYLQQRELALFLVPLTRTEQGTKICWPKLKDRYMESQRYSQIQIHHKDCSHGAEIKLFDCRSCISCHGTIATLLPCPHVRMSSVFFGGGIQVLYFHPAYASPTLCARILCLDLPRAPTLTS